MRALFITTKTNETDNHVRAWESVYGPAAHITFDHLGIRNDWQFLEAAEREKPDIVFYIGANQAPGNPKPETLRALRKFAPTVLVCSDAADKPWHKVLGGYRFHNCFTLQVSIDGARSAPVDLATLTPVDSRPFDAIQPVRDIRFGFSGTVGRWNARSETILALEWFGGLKVRHRHSDGSYEDHVGFLKRCQILLNMSFTGTQHAHHIKGRVVEAGFAGCALLEFAGSPIGDWFPEGCWFPFRDPHEAAEIVRSLSDAEIERSAAALSSFVREHYTPNKIYGSILEKAGVPRRPSSIADHSIKVKTSQPASFN